jgi:sugar phosphate isomerase/epimerase
MKTTRPLGVSTSLFAGRLGPDCPESSLSILAGGPIRHVEYFCADSNRRYYDDAHLALTREILVSGGITAWSVHAPFDRTDVSQVDDAGRAESCAHVVRAMEVAVKLEAGIVVLHGSQEPITDDQRPQRLANCGESLHRLCDEAEARGLTLACEMLPRTCLGNRTAEMLDLIEATGGRLRVCYDVNHITLYEDVRESLRVLGDKVATLHISDHDGIDERHWIPGRGIVNWQDFVAGLDDIGYTGCLMHEAVDSDVDLAGNLKLIEQAARDCLAWTGE